MKLCVVLANRNAGRMKDGVPRGNKGWSGGSITSVLLHANPIVHLTGAYEGLLNWNLKELLAEFRC